jgi:hypothetical protein
MLNSAFSDGNQTEGSNKQFVKLREEENITKKRNLVDRLAVSEQEYPFLFFYPLSSHSSSLALPPILPTFSSTFHSFSRRLHILTFSPFQFFD